MVIVVAVMPGADAVLVPESLELVELPQAASNPATQMIAIPLIRSALPPITLFNRTSFLYAGSFTPATRYLARDRPNPPPPFAHPLGGTPSELGRWRESSVMPPGCRAAPRAWRSQGCRHKSDRKSTRLNSSHSSISYAVFCLKKKT